MKKSEILKAVKKKMKNPYAYCYICNNIKRECDIECEDLDRPFYNIKKENGRLLVNWIEDSIKSDPDDFAQAENKGVAAWLFNNDFIDYFQYDNQANDKDIKEYRQLWLKDMIVYWKSQGE